VRADGTAISAGERLDAVVLAHAGLQRLGLAGHATEILPVELSLPAAGQGALAIEVKRGSRAEEICQQLDQPEASSCVRAERAVLESLGGSCTVPIGAYAIVRPAAQDQSVRELFLRAVLGGPDGSAGIKLLRAEASAPMASSAPEALGARVAELLRQAGAEALLRAAGTSAGLPAPKR